MVQEKPLNGIFEDRILVSLTPEEYFSFKASGEINLPRPRNIGCGLKSIMELFGCTKAKAFNISHADWFDPAIILRDGRTLSFDMDLAMDLAKKNRKKSPSKDELK